MIVKRATTMPAVATAVFLVDVGIFRAIPNSRNNNQATNGVRIPFLYPSYGYSMAIMENDRLWVWGFNDGGQPGNGTTTCRSIPVHIMDNVMLPTFSGNL